MSESPDTWAPPSGPVIDPTPPQRRNTVTSRILIWGGVALIVIGVLGFVVDWAARNWEMMQLLSRIETSESAMVEAKDRISSVDLPPNPTPEQIQQASGEIQRIAADGSGAVAEAGEGVGELTFLPWHTELVRAQGAYRAHNQAWVDYLGAGSQDAKALFTDDNDIAPTWEQAEVRVRGAVPFLAWPGIGTRIDSIFTDDEPSQEQQPKGIPV